jgi:predicted nuclease with TOPRIM domain
MENTEDYYKLFNIKMQIWQYDQFSRRMENIEGELKSLNDKFSNLDKNFEKFKERTYWLFILLGILVLLSPHLPTLAKLLWTWLTK